MLPRRARGRKKKSPASIRKDWNERGGGNTEPRAAELDLRNVQVPPQSFLPWQVLSQIPQAMPFKPRMVLVCLLSCGTKNSPHGILLFGLVPAIALNC